MGSTSPARLGMRPIFVVIPQLVRNGLTRLTPILAFVQIDTLVFERAPQTLDEDVVPPSALAVHGDLYLGLLEDLDKIAALNWLPWSVLKISGLP